MKTSLFPKYIIFPVGLNSINRSLPAILFLLLSGLHLAANPRSGKIPTDYSNDGSTKNGTVTNAWKNFAVSYFQQKLLADTVIRGKVTTKEGVPLQGVSVLVKGKNRGTTTNETGAFTLSGVLPASTVVFSIIGFESQEVKPAGRVSLTIALEPAANTLADVVVTGFQNIDKKKFTGAAVTLKAVDVRMDGYTDVSRMLEGKAAGVSIQNVSSTFGSAPKVRIRGATSINGDNKPLWVVDGVVLEDIVNISNDQLSSGDPTTLLGSPVAGINANDIESFDILKDAAATALYGARAMNGVVVITTKKGRSGKPSINYTGNFSTQLKPMYADYNIMNSAQQMSVLGELERKGILTSNVLNSSNYGVYGKMYSLLNPDANGNFPLQNTTEAKVAFLKKAALINTDWFDILFRNSLMQEHSLSISSGTEKSQHFFSTSFYNDNGWTIADKVKRYTLNFRNNYTLSDRLTAGFLTTASVRQQKVPGSLKRVSNPVTGDFDRDFDINPFSYVLNSSRTLSAYNDAGNLEYYQRNFAPFNIIKELQNNYIDLSVIDLKLQGELGYKITKNLRYEFIGALRYVRSSQEHQITENSNMANAYRAAGTSEIKRSNKFLYRDPDDPGAQPIVVLPYGGFYNRTEDRLLNFDVRNSLNYTNTIAEKHNINILLGQQIKYADRQNFNNTGYGYQYDNGGIPFVDYRILKQTIESSFPYYDMSKNYDRFAAFYLNAQYTYDRKYNFYGTVRYDGSNQLGSSRKARWLPTWSFGGAWNIEEEAFMKDVTAVNFLKLRASYGLTASLGPATNSNIVLKSATTNRTFPTERESVIQLINLENSDLTWEKNYQANLGLDGGLFKGKLNFSLDVYSRKSFDLISRIKTSGIGGEAYKTANYADLNSQGAEVLIGGQVIKMKNWGWRTNLTFGYNTSKISNVKNQPLIFDLVKAEGGNTEGHPVNSLFSIRFNGLDHATGIPQFTNQEGKSSNDVYLQADSTQYLKYEGPVDPTITGGFSNTFTYKAFSLNIFISYQAGNKIRLYPVFKTGYSDFNALPKEFNDRWEMPGDELTTRVPSILDAFYKTQLGGAYPYNNYNYSTERVADGGFVRLKTVSLTYNLDAVQLERIGLTNASVTAAAINPLLIYSDPKLKGQDPEFFNSGGVAQPIQKQFTLSLKLGL
jgi:TonB-linked SusC/RagA family outer membrane protein